ncbi:hypothetical protein KGQ71_02125 [Patescibacteria group bacterium]|nr:hypothetical protein [Patescibacteria group bacterium]
MTIELVPPPTSRDQPHSDHVITNGQELKPGTPVGLDGNRVIFEGVADDGNILITQGNRTVEVPREEFLQGARLPAPPAQPTLATPCRNPKFNTPPPFLTDLEHGKN